MNRVEFKNVTKYYTLLQTGGIKDFLFHLPSYLRGLRKNRILALKNVSFSVADGEVVAIIGKNGAGKSTTLGLIAGVLVPTEGEVVVNGRIAPLLELGAGFHPDLTGRENIILNGILLGMTKREITEKLEQIIEFSELGDFIDKPIRIYSSGMLSRLGFSVAVHSNPDILLVDEVLSVGDIEFQKKSIRKIYEFKERGKTIVFVSHDMPLVKELADKAIVINNREKLFEGDPKEAVKVYESL
ncbi:ABC transporter ATP-binding protein [Thermovibrio ammonificans]